MPVRLTFLALLMCVISACGDTDSQQETKQHSTPQSTTTVVTETVSTTTPATQHASPPLDKAQVKALYQDQPLKILDITEQQYDNGPAIAVIFNIPLDPNQTYSQFIQLKHKQQSVQDGDWILSDNGKTLYFPYVEPSASYHLLIKPGITALNEQSYDFSKEATLDIKSINPSATFTSKGAFLPADLSTGLPVSAVNINAVTIDFHRVKPDQLLRFLNDSKTLKQEQGYYGTAELGYELDRINRYTDLVYTGRFQLDGARNKRHEHLIPVSDIETLQQPGLYFAVMTPAGQYAAQRDTTYFSITDIGMHVRSYNNSVDVFTRSLKTGKALQDATVTLLQADNHQQQQTVSPQGLAHFDVPLRQVQGILVQHGEHMAILQANSPALDLNKFAIGQRPQKPSEIFIYSPRDLYRPGEVIELNALARNYDGQALPTHILSATLRKPDRQIYKEWNWSTQQQGYYHQTIQLADDVPTGAWSAEITTTDGQQFSYRLNIEDFLPERMTLSFNQDNPDPIVASPEQTLQLPVQGDYLFGAPAAGNRLTTIVQPELAEHPLPQWDDFYFGHQQDSDKLDRFEHDVLFLDDNGRSTLRIASQWDNIQSPLWINVFSSLYESGGRPVSRSYKALVWPKKPQIGIRPHFTEQQTDANGWAEFDVLQSDIKGQLQAAMVNVSLISEARDYYWEWSADEGWHYEFNQKEYSVFNQALTLSDAQAIALKVPVDFGHYRLEIVDAKSGAKSSFRFMAGEDWYSAWRNSQSEQAVVRPDLVTLSLDQKHYRAGDTARLSIKPNGAGPAIVLVEADRLLWSKQIELPAEGTVLDIPVDKSWDRHDLYVSVIALQPGNKANLTSPKRAFGLIHLPLNREDRHLKLSIDAPKKIEPLHTLTAQLQLEAGYPTQTPLFVTLAAVDSGVLSITDFETPDPFEAFYGQRRYNVDGRDNYHLLIDPSAAPNARLAFGGDAKLKRGGAQQKNEVQIVSLFQQPVQFNAQGQAEVSFDVPDFNGELRLMAVAFGTDQFGHAEQTLKVATPVVTQLSRPRFMAFGDQSTLAFDVQNLTGATQSLQVSVELGEPLTLTDNSEQAGQQYNANLTLQDKQKQTLYVPIKALPVLEQGRITLNVQGEQIKPIRRHWTLPVRPPFPAVTQRLQRVVTADHAGKFNLPAMNDYYSELTQLDLSVTNLVDLNIKRQVKSLLQYPYGCLEQTSSRLTPWILLDREQALSLQLENWDLQQKSKAIDESLTRIANMQLNNGGYGLWDNQSPEEHWLTAYVGDLLVTAQQQGIQVSPTQYKKTLDRLHKYVLRRGNFITNRWSEKPKHYSFAAKAYAAYVLSRVNQVSLSELRTLERNESDNAMTPLPLVHLALALHQQGDKQLAAAVLKRALQRQTLQDHYRYYYGDYGSPIRDTALMVQLLLTHKLNSSDALTLAEKLRKVVDKQRWLSTQERNALLVAGLALSQQTATPWQLNLQTNAASTTQLQQTGLWQSSWPRTELADSLLLTTEQTQPLFASLDIMGYPSKAPMVYSRSLEIERHYYNQQGQQIQPTQIDSGELLIVHLQVNADQRIPDALVVDLLPAGLELENQNLKHALNLELFKIDGKSIEELISNSKVVYQQYRDDRFVAAVQINRYDTTHLFYLARAVTPGRYLVPPPLAEDMYRPYLNAIGDTLPSLTIKAP